MSAADLDELLSTATGLLLDFDGPICSVYAGSPPERAAAQLVALATELGAEPPADVRDSPDPMNVLAWSVGLGRPEVVDALDVRLTEIEVAVIESARMTPGAVEVIEQAHRLGLPVGIASNNSTASLAAFLDLHDLGRFMRTVVGRPPGQPELMKPDPHIVSRAAAELSEVSAPPIFVGDSLTDIDAARAARVPVIALANRPVKVALFTHAHADVVITSMLPLAAALERSG